MSLLHDNEKGQSKKRKLTESSQVEEHQKPKKLSLWEQLVSPSPNDNHSGEQGSNGFRLSSLWESES